MEKRWNPLDPSGYVKIAIENGPIEIVDLPMIFHSYVSLPEDRYFEELLSLLHFIHSVRLNMYFTFIK